MRSDTCPASQPRPPGDRLHNVLSAFKESKMLYWRDTCVTLVNGHLLVHAS